MVVDDDPDILHTLSRHLRRSGFGVTTAQSVMDARKRLSEETVDLCILDIMMPGESGLTFCEDLRRSNNIPIIFLTALNDDNDKLVGFEYGADDYVSKPFNPHELVARIHAVLRRLPDAAEKETSSDIPKIGRWRLNAQQSELMRDDGVVVTLSTGELSVLSVLAAHVGEVLSRDDLMRETHGRATLAFERTIDNVILRLRKKIEHDPANPRLIKTVRGGGYRLVI